MAVNQPISVDLGLPNLPETTDKELFPELVRIHNAIRILAGGIDLYTGAIRQDEAVRNELDFSATIRSQDTKRIYIVAGEDIAFGALVHFYNDAGTLKARNANATDATKPVRAYCSEAAVTSGNLGEFTLFNGLHPGFAAATLTPGQEYYLSTTDGLLTSSAPASSGNLVQFVGFALSDTELYFCPSQANNAVVP